MTKVLLADDHAIMRDGLREILETAGGFELVGEAANGNDVLESLHWQMPDLLMMDLSMPGLSGINLIEQIRKLHPKIKLLVLTMLDDPQIALRAIKAGANGFITKDSPATELVAAIRKVAAGGQYLDRRVSEQMVFGATSDLPHEKLSRREMTIFGLLVTGMPLTRIADQLFISDKTVSTHKAHLMEKIGAKNMAELMRYALQHNLFP